MAWKPRVKIQKGRFTDWCKRQGYKGVTEACINKGQAAKSASVKRMANFAWRARHGWRRKVA